MENKIYADFHTHSVYSDGELTPRQIAQEAAFKGLTLMALTDHDNLGGYEEMRRETGKFGIQTIPGVEITTPRYHLLALGFDPKNAEFNQFIDYSRAIQREVCSQRVNLLQKAGIPVTMEMIDQEFPESRLGKWSIFLTMMKNPESRYEVIQQFPEMDFRGLWRHFCDGKMAGKLENTPGVSVEDAIRYTHQAGGLIGIAHPQKDVEDISELYTLIEQGIDFIEDQPNIREKQFKLATEKVLAVAAEKGIPLSHGSDYHGASLGRVMLDRTNSLIEPGIELLLKKPQGRFDSQSAPRDDYILTN